MQHGKAYRKVAEQVDKTKLYGPVEAIQLAKTTNPVKFDATVEVAMRLGVDPRKADQMVRGTVNLPHGTGKTARVIVFASGDKAVEAEAAGADSSAPTNSSPAFRKAGWISTRLSPRRTRWPRSVGSRGSWAPAVSCRTRRRARSPWT